MLNWYFVKPVAMIVIVVACFGVTVFVELCVLSLTEHGFGRTSVFELEVPQLSNAPVVLLIYAAFFLVNGLTVAFRFSWFFAASASASPAGQGWTLSVPLPAMGMLSAVNIAFMGAVLFVYFAMKDRFFY
jgi:hypothetical protein